METGLVANRIERALAYASSKILPADYTEQLVADIDSIVVRYATLKSPPHSMDFDKAASVARTEFIERVLTEKRRTRDEGLFE